MLDQNQKRRMIRKEMNETLEFCCPKMRKAIDKQWIELLTFPHTNTIEFMTNSIVLIYCPLCGEYLPETSDILAKAEPNCLASDEVK
jgi:hypothetical protein